MLIETKRPDDCSEQELKLFQSLILQGSEIESPRLMDKIKQAYQLVFIYQDDEPVGVSALRYSSMDYCKGLFEQAGVPQLLANYAYEVGWAFTTKASRGRNYGHLLMQSALEQADGKKCFATAKEDNLAAHAIFKRFGLERLGHAYASSRGEYSLGLFGQQ